MKSKKNVFFVILFIVTFVIYFLELKFTNCYFDSKFAACDTTSVYFKSYFVAIMYMIVVFIICHYVFKNKLNYYGYLCVFLTLFNFILYFDFIIMFPYKMILLNCNFKLSMLLVTIEPLCLWAGFYLNRDKKNKKRV